MLVYGIAVPIIFVRLNTLFEPTNLEVNWYMLEVKLSKLCVCVCMHQLVWFLVCSPAWFLCSLLQNTNMYMWPWCNRIRPVFLEQKGNVFLCCSTNYAFNARCVWYLFPDSQRCVVSCPLPLLFFLFWVFGYTHTQYVFHVTKNTRLSMPAQLQCSH